jgi:hypothetical protein
VVRWSRSRAAETTTGVSKLYDKLDAANRAQAIMAAVRAGLLTGAPAD